MENISYIGLSQQVALTSMMNVTANNIANMSTPGYKGQRTLFVDYLNKGKDAGPKDAGKSRPTLQRLPHLVQPGPLAAALPLPGPEAGDDMP